MSTNESPDPLKTPAHRPAQQFWHATRLVTHVRRAPSCIPAGRRRNPRTRRSPQLRNAGRTRGLKPLIRRHGRVLTPDRLLKAETNEDILLDHQIGRATTPPALAVPIRRPWHSPTATRATAHEWERGEKMAGFSACYGPHSEPPSGIT